MVNDTTAHAQESIYWVSVSEPHLLDKMYVCLYILFVYTVRMREPGEPSPIYGGLYHDATHSHNYLRSCNTQVSECKVQDTSHEQSQHGQGPLTDLSLQ